MFAPNKLETASPLACAVCTVFRAILRTQLKAGETIALVRAGGGLGLLGVKFAKAMGLVVVGVDARDEGLNLAKESGADVIVDARLGKERFVEEVQKVINGYGADSVTISDEDTAVALACAVTKMYRSTIQISQPSEVKIPFRELVFRDIRINGSLICTRSEAQRMLQIVADHDINVKTNPFLGLYEVPELIDLVHTSKMAGKGVCIVSEEEQAKVEKGKQSSV